VLSPAEEWLLAQGEGGEGAVDFGVDPRFGDEGGKLAEGEDGTGGEGLNLAEAGAGSPAGSGVCFGV